MLDAIEHRGDAGSREESDQEGQPVVLRDESPRRRRQRFRPYPFDVVTVPNLPDLTPFGELLHADEVIVYGYAGYQGIAKSS